MNIEYRMQMMNLIIDKRLKKPLREQFIDMLIMGEDALKDLETHELEQYIVDEYHDDFTRDQRDEFMLVNPYKLTEWIFAQKVENHLGSFHEYI